MSSGYLGGIKGQVLSLCHLYRYRLEVGHPRRTAKALAARSAAAEHLRLVPYSDLPELYPHPENSGEILDQFAEIDPAVCREIKYYLVVIKCIFYIDELHLEAKRAV